MAGHAAILMLMTVLLAGPLVLGSYVVVQRANRTTLLAWFGLLTSLLVVALAVGALALFLAV